MRILHFCIILTAVFLTACASTSNTRYTLLQEAADYKGSNISTVTSKWGMPDQTLHTREGTSYYVYNTYAGGFDASSYQMQENTMPGFGRGLATTEGYNTAYGNLSCTTIFETNSANIIISAQHKGSNCGGKWVTKKS